MLFWFLPPEAVTPRTRASETSSERTWIKLGKTRLTKLTLGEPFCNKMINNNILCNIRRQP